MNNDELVAALDRVPGYKGKSEIRPPLGAQGYLGEESGVVIDLGNRRWAICKSVEVGDGPRVTWTVYEPIENDHEGYGHLIDSGFVHVGPNYNTVVDLVKQLDVARELPLPTDD